MDVNDLDFPNFRELVRASPRLAKSIAQLRVRCKRIGIPVVYVNANYSKWRSNFSAVLKHSLREDSPELEMVQLLPPEPDDYIVLKPNIPAFYATPLETILAYIGTRNVIASGLTTNACVLLTAADLYVREFKIFVPQDCVHALNAADHERALRLMKNSYAAYNSFIAHKPSYFGLFTLICEF